MAREDLLRFADKDDPSTNKNRQINGIYRSNIWSKKRRSVSDGINGSPNFADFSGDPVEGPSRG